MGKKIIALIFILVLIGIISGARSFVIDLGGDQKTSLVFKGIRRTYLTHLPLNYDDSESTPLVFVFHGAGGNSEMMRKTTGFNEVADKENFIVVYPNGTGLFDNYVLSWNAGKCCNYVEPFGVDDVAFVKFLINKLQREYNIDESRIYVTGMSNGGMMVYRLGCEIADIISGIAVVSASMPLPEDNCKPNDYLPVLIFHGTTDTVIPYEGGEAEDFLFKWFELDHYSVIDSVLFWAEHNQCDSNSTRLETDKFSKIIYQNCQKEAEVLFYTLEPGGHIWPGGEKTWFLGGEPIEGIPASEIIWEFFEKHPKNSE